MGWLSLKGWDMGYGMVGFLKRCRCDARAAGSRAVQEYPEFPTRVWEAQVGSWQLTYG